MIRVRGQLVNPRVNWLTTAFVFVAFLLPYLLVEAEPARTVLGIAGALVVTMVGAVVVRPCRILVDGGRVRVVEMVGRRIVAEAAVTAVTVVSSGRCRLEFGPPTVWFDCRHRDQLLRLVG